jgi:cytochrome c peroxidase
MRRCLLLLGVSGLLVASLAWSGIVGQAPSQEKYPINLDQPQADYDWQAPNELWRMPFEQVQPISFVNRGEQASEWDALPGFWNETSEKVVNPATGLEVTRKAVKIKVPLGLTANPPIPQENPLTVQKWALGKKLYFDHVLSSDGTVACASCHEPLKGYTDQAPVSTGIGRAKGGISAPTVINSAYNGLQFWDGRAHSLEDQAQAPPQNPIEMFDGKGHPWNRVVYRLREQPEYVKEFKAVFGTLPTRDAAAKAIASYERTVLSGNAIYDRAQFAMLYRAAEEEILEPKIDAKDYEKVLKEAFANKDTVALKALKLDPATDLNKVPAVAQSLVRGQNLFFSDKTGCVNCHAGHNFTDNLFHNLGVGFEDGKLTESNQGRIAALPTGHKNVEAVGAFKTPTLRHLVATAPYLHDGSEATLEKTVEFYDEGGHANRFLSPKMRDLAAEAAYRRAQLTNTPYKGPEVKLFAPDQVPIVPKKLNLSDTDKKDLVLFMRALHGDPPPPIVADPDKFPVE